MLARPPSLQGRLIRSVLAVVALIWCAAAGLTWFDARHELDELLDAHLAQAASLLLIQKFGDFDADDLVAGKPAAAARPSRVMYQVFQASRLALKSDDAPAAPMSAAGGAQGAHRTVDLGGVGWRVYALSDPARGVDVFVAERLASRREILWAVLRGMLWPLVLALPLLAGATWWAVRRGVGSVRALGRAVQARRPGALEPISVDDLGAELQPLLAAINDLFGRVAALLESERRFTADAAHELRTPIAAIRIQAQVAAAERGEAARQHALAATLDGCDRATRLVEQLLTLSRLEADGWSARTTVDLREVVRRVVGEAAPRAYAKRQELTFEAALACPVLGDEALLAVLARNLIDNAVRYCPPAARIEVRLSGDAGGFALDIDDSGPGLDETQLARLGERFFRVTGNGESGSGLGWSIARRICLAHGFTLRAARSAPLGGLAARVSGPMARGQG